MTATTRTRILTALAATAGAAAVGVTIAWQRTNRQLDAEEPYILDQYVAARIGCDLLDLRAELADSALEDQWRVYTRNQLLLPRVVGMLDSQPDHIVERIARDLDASQIMYQRPELYRRIADRLITGERILRNAGHRTARVY